ncbi:MAG TPA: hypothetical protein VD927_17515 [Chryseosolibacter sp.]|nr:hypothetical protein [Chryseosolibacter sp.]
MNSKTFQIILGIATLVIVVITLLLTIKEGKRLLDNENDKPVVYAMNESISSLQQSPIA